MTKQEQIEEMEKVMPEKIKDPLDNSRYIIFGKSLRREIARIYYNAGYRKLPEDSVVLSMEEYKRITKELVTEQRATEIAKEYFIKHNEQIRKEAVKDFAEKVKMAFFYEFDEIIPSIMSDKIDELIKEFEKW